MMLFADTLLNLITPKLASKNMLQFYFHHNLNVILLKSHMYIFEDICMLSCIIDLAPSHIL